MAEKPDFDKIFANKATSVHEWDSDNYNTGWGFLGETPPPHELFDSLQRENDTKAKYLYERTEEVNTDLNDKYDELKTGLGGANTALQQHNVDENAHANLFQRALVTETNVAANTADWNTLIESRTYKITGATFAADKHQPVGAIGTGELVVLKNGDDTIVQVYYANSTEFDKAGAYHRVNIGGTWTDWVYNITNKGGTVTGDFNINGKLTVDTIEVSDSLTIGGAEPLGQDAIDKLQAQIIAPSQTLYIDQKNGNDNNDGTSQSKAVRTLDKVISLITQNIPTLTINFVTYTDEEDLIYNTFSISEPINNDNLQVGTIRLIGNYENFISNRIVAKIIVPYGRMGTGVLDSSDGQEYYQWGRVFIKNCSGVLLQSVIFEFPTDTSDTTKYRNSVFYGFSGTFSMKEYNGNTMTLPANCHLFNLYNSTNVDKIEFSIGTIVNGTITGDGLLITASNSTRYKTDPKTTDGTKSYPGDELFGLITKYLKLSGGFSGNVLGTTKGLPSNVNAIYTYGFD